MSPVYLGGTRLNELRIGGTRINKGYVGSTLVYSSEFIGTVTITTVIRYAGVLVNDTNCVPAGAEVAMVASISGTATDATFAWTRPAGSSAPVAGLTTGTLTWTAVAGDGGTYGVTVTSRNSPDGPKTAQETVNIFSYTKPGFADVDANNWIIKAELSDCGAFEPGIRTVMNNLVLDLKSSGFFGTSTVIHPMLGARTTRGLVPLKTPGAYVIYGTGYDRQFGIKTTTNTGGVNTKAVAARHINASLGPSMNAGAAGIASYISRWSDGGEAFAGFAYDQLNTVNARNAYLYFGFKHMLTEILASQSVMLEMPVVPMFYGAQVNGITTRTSSVRVNTRLDTGMPVTGTPSTNSSITAGALPRAVPFASGYFVDHAFLIAGGGASDYSSDALRLIVENYVASIQAAIPG